jgi:amino acid adenylation domain-containing protein
MDNLSKLIADLSPEDLSRLAMQFSQKSEAVAVNQSIPKRKQQNNLPLSFAQQRLWFIERLLPEGAIYNMAFGVRLIGSLNVDALERSFGEIIRRHEVLRTSFPIVDGTPVQHIAPAGPINLRVIDLSALDHGQREDKVRALNALEEQKPFDIASGPLMRMMLLKISEQEHVLLLTMHHIINDGWSTGVLVKEVAEFYRAYSLGEAPQIEELPIQYGDYALWQRESLQGEVLEAQLAYWRENLAGAPAAIDLPTDKPRPTVKTSSGAEKSVFMGNGLLHRLKSFSQQEGVSLFMLMLAAFKVLLYRYTSQEDILVGTPIAGRNRSEMERLIGFFINTLVLRTDLSGDPTFYELLGRVRKVALGAFKHQDIPFEKLVEELQPERDTSREPLLQVVFVVQNAPTEPLQLPGLTLSSLPATSSSSEFDLTLVINESGEDVGASINYATDLFEERSIERLLRHYHTLLEDIVTNPGKRISRLSLLSEAERAQLLPHFSGEESTHKNTACIHELFQQQVEQSPDAIALAYEGEQLTYKELNERANQVAHYLISRGVKAETLVGICMERGFEMIVGLLGVLKAGGAYVPLDPAYPKARLEYMVRDSGAELILTQQRLIEQMPETSAEKVSIDGQWEEISRQSRENTASKVDADNLAYVMYTSGSTGEPKGVMVQHKGLVNLSYAQGELFDVSPEDRVLQFASISFDASISEIMMALSRGARLCLARQSELIPGPEFVKMLEREKISNVTMPPSALAVMPEAELKEMKTLIVAGETCSAEIVRKWKKGRRMYNAYGPTETSVCATAGECEGGNRRPDIGEAIKNTNVYILDKEMEIVPVGVSGEIYVGGEGLARGYKGRAEVTADKYRPNPHGGKGERMYATGDIGRRRDDGKIEYIGRKDEQVKVRGFRIETGEIESALIQHEFVRDAVVSLYNAGNGNNQLIGYVVPEREHEISASDLKQFLSQRIPEYMLPAAFISLSSIPLTPNGKVDRRNLPLPDLQRLRVQKDCVAPSTESEMAVAAIWKDVLGLSEVSIDESFFDIGGHSLSLVQVQSRLNSRFETDVAMIELFRYSTIRRLAEYLDQAELSSDSALRKPPSLLAELRAGDSDHPLFLIHGMGGGIFNYRDLASQFDGNQAVYGIQAMGLDGSEEPFDRVELMASHYIEVMRERQPEGPYFLGGASFGGLVAYEMAQLLSAQKQKVDFLALIDTPGPGQMPERPEGDANILSSLLGNVISLPADQLQMLDPDEQIVFALEQMRAANVLPSGIGFTEAKRILKIWRTNAEAMFDYVPRPYTGRVTFFRAVDRSGGYPPNPESPWIDMAGDGIEIHVVPGNHNTMLLNPNAETLVRKLKGCISRAF